MQISHHARVAGAAEHLPCLALVPTTSPGLRNPQQVPGEQLSLNKAREDCS